LKGTANILATFKAAKLIQVAKGQFETTEAYAARMKSAAAALAPRGTLAVALTLDPRSFNFDADKNSVSYSNPADDCTLATFIGGYMTPKLACIRQKISVTRSRPRIMRNAFGAAASVVTVSTVDIGVTNPPVDPGEADERHETSPLRDIRFGATVSEAVSLKRNAVLVLTLKPEAPFYVDAGWSADATIDNPIEPVERAYLLAGRLLCASIMDRVSGKVFQTQDFTERTIDRSQVAVALSVAEWITEDDVPQGANPTRSGMVEITISDVGRVDGCVVRQSSGDPAVDELACTLITRRGRFVPSRSKGGLPLASTRMVEIPWAKILSKRLPVSDENNRF
jgi:TonB family protein